MLRPAFPHPVATAQQPRQKSFGHFLRVLRALRAK